MRCSCQGYRVRAGLVLYELSLSCHDGVSWAVDCPSRKLTTAERSSINGVPFWFSFH